jgi:hypothetical protein
MRVVSVALACGLSVFLAQCAYFADPNSWPQKFEFGDSATLASGADIRFVSERERERPSAIPGGVPPLPTMCTEPSPDVAVAFGRSLSAQASVTEQGGSSGSGQFAAASTETATELAGRTAGVLALRDGLYAACQAYTNGVLGQDAYAMVLSQYGNLLVALAGSNTGAGAAQTYMPYSPHDVALATLLVSCITEYDPTRLAAVGSNGKLVPNQMLSASFCHRLLATIASGKPMTAAAATTTTKKAQTTLQTTQKIAQATPSGSASQSVTIKVTGPSSGGDSGVVGKGAATAGTPATTLTTPSTTPSSQPAKQ